MGKIYLITNTVNSKIYVGQTSKSIPRRWNKHKSDSKYRNSPLYVAIRYYGFENFKIEELESAEITKLNTLETIWIAKLKSNDLDIGYNMTTGGSCGTHTLEARLEKSKRMQPLNDHENEMKRCSICGVVKHYSKFTKSTCNGFGTNYHCNDCRSERRKVPKEEFRYKGKLVNSLTEKYCAHCDNVLLRSEFYSNGKRGKGGGYCKTCTKQVALEYYHKRKVTSL